MHVRGSPVLLSPCMYHSSVMYPLMYVLLRARTREFMVLMTCVCGCFVVRGLRAQTTTNVRAVGARACRGRHGRWRGYARVRPPPPFRTTIPAPRQTIFSAQSTRVSTPRAVGALAGRYRLPSAFSALVEDNIVATVHELVRTLRGGGGGGGGEPVVHELDAGQSTARHPMAPASRWQEAQGRTNE